MTKEELRKDFYFKWNDKEMSAVALIDWFYSKLEERERIIEAKDEKIKSMYDEIDTAVRLYAESEAKLKEKDKEIDKVLRILSWLSI